MADDMCSCFCSRQPILQKDDALYIKGRSLTITPPFLPIYLFYSCRSHLTFIVSSINTRQFPFLLFSILLLRQFHIHNNAMTQLDNKIEKELLRKLDRRLVAWAALAYFSNVLLRNNMRKCSIIVFIKSGNRHWRIIHVPYYELISTRIYQWHEHWPSSEFICL